MSQTDCPTPHIHTEIEPLTCCAITLVQYRNGNDIENMSFRVASLNAGKTKSTRKY